MDMAAKGATRKRTGATERLFTEPVEARKNAPQSMQEVRQTTTLEHEALKWSGYEELSADDKKTVQGAAVNILRLHDEVTGLWKMTILKAAQVGQYLAEVKEILPYGLFGDWIEIEFPFHHETANNYMNLASLGQRNPKVLESGIPISGLFALARAPESAVQIVEAQVESGKSPNVQQTKDISWRHKALADAGVVEEARIQLGNAQLVDDYKDMKWIGKQEKTVQMEVTSKLVTGEVKSVRAAMRLLPPSPAASAASTVKVELKQQIQYYPGEWQTIIRDIPANSVDLIVLDAPSRQDYLEVYKDLAAECAEILKDHGIVLATVGHQALQQVGTMVKDYLRINWTLAVRKRPGHSKRMNWTNISASWQPVCVWYKGTWKQPDEIIDDLRTYDEETQEDEGGLKLLTVEDGIADYVERLIHQTETMVHLVPEAKSSYDLAPKFVEIARSKNVGKLIGIGIPAP